MPPQSNEELDRRRAAMSALMDGEPDAADETCRAWRTDALLRADWHAYHVISDAMRSDEHRCDALRDAQMLARIRQRLALEPVVLAPAVLPSSRRRSARAWLAPAAMVAGFAAVAGVMVVTRMAAEPGGAAASGQALAGSAAAPMVAVTAPGLAASTTASDNVSMIRDAQLDRYLAAHRQYANGAAQVTPGGVVRNAAMTAPGR
jgi:sigma-E factor negative regulatory protein RseA